MNHLNIPREILKQIMSTIGTNPVESGGIFAIHGNTISDYYFDAEAGVGNRFYRPSMNTLTAKGTKWIQDGQTFGGFIHSHRAQYSELSPMDIVTAEMTMSVNNMKSLFMAIICEKKLYLYRVTARPQENTSVVENCEFTITSSTQRDMNS